MKKISIIASITITALFGGLFLYSYYWLTDDVTPLPQPNGGTPEQPQVFIPTPFDPFRGNISFNQLIYPVVNTSSGDRVEFRKNEQYSNGTVNIAADVYVNGEHVAGQDGRIGASGVSQISFSPNGKYLALIARNRSGAFAESFRLWIIDVTNRKLSPSPWYKHSSCCEINEFQAIDSYRWVDNDKMEITYLVAKANEKGGYNQISEKENQTFDLN